MFTRPPDLPDEVIERCLRDGWGVAVDRVEYLAAGFGSHHWVSTDWFVTVDLDTPRRSTDELLAALRTARVLSDTGMTGLVAPMPGLHGDVVWRGGPFSVSLFPRLGASALEASRHPDHTAVLALLGDLHSRTESVRGIARPDSLEIVGRAELLATLGALSTPWSSGPFGEPVRELLSPRVCAIDSGLREVDGIVAGLDRSQWVITHGEPHDRNILETPDGPVLIDWDTARIGPAARDVWHVGDGTRADEYTELTGHVIPNEEIALYRLLWDLGEIAEYAVQFAGPHGDDEDAAIAFEGLTESIESLLAR